MDSVLTCGGVGASCNVTGGCCGGDICDWVTYKCVANNNLSNGNYCIGNSECASGHCNMPAPGENAQNMCCQTVLGELSDPIDMYSGCSDNSPCCSGHCGTKGEVNGQCCSFVGEACNKDSDCCLLSGGDVQNTPDLKCADGDVNQHTCCLTSGATCSTSGSCCSGSCVSGQCFCFTNQACYSDQECCSGHCNSSHVCTPIANGQYCWGAGESAPSAGGCDSGVCLDINGGDPDIGGLGTCSDCAVGKGCTDNADCCAGQHCNAAACKACIPDSQNGCNVDNDCCNSTNHYCFGGFCDCMQTGTHTCTRNNMCCSGSCNTGTGACN